MYQYNPKPTDVSAGPKPANPTPKAPTTSSLPPERKMRAMRKLVQISQEEEKK